MTDFIKEIRLAVLSLARLSASCEEVVRRVDALAKVLEEAADLLKAGSPEMDHSVRSRRVKPSDRKREQLLKRIAARGIPASDFSIHLLPDGSGTLILEDVPIALTPREAALAKILSEDGGMESGPLIDFKSISAIKAKLEKLMDRPYTTASINQISFILRKKLRRHGVNPHLLQRSQNGLRWALRRKSVAA